MKHQTTLGQIFALLLLALSLSACQNMDKKTACAPMAPKTIKPVAKQPVTVLKTKPVTAPAAMTKQQKPIKRYTMDEVKGVYAAILPCADCLGIETLLTLNGDGQYILHETYENLEQSAFDSFGRWVIAGGQIIVLIPAQTGQTAYQFAIDSKDNISMLGLGGEHPKDERYVLKRR